MLLYSASNTGEVPTPGAYSKTTLFGDTALTGGYRVGIGLADTNGSILTTTTSSNENPVQVTSIDDRSFTFGDCTRSASAGVGVGSAASTVANTTVAPSATPSILSTRIVVSSTVTTSSTSTSATAAPINTIYTTANSQPIAPAHNGINKGAIAGAVMGSIVLLLLSIFSIRWCTSR